MSNQKNKIYKLLTYEAMEDNIITPEETKIISHAMKTALSFDQFLEQSMEDGFIDAEERKKLDQLRDRIYKETKKVAEEDEKITPDEAKLLSKLSKKLENLKDYDKLS